MPASPPFSLPFLGRLSQVQLSPHLLGDMRKTSDRLCQRTRSPSQLRPLPPAFSLPVIVFLCPSASLLCPPLGCRRATSPVGLAAAPGCAMFCRAGGMRRCCTFKGRGRQSEISARWHPTVLKAPLATRRVPELEDKSTLLTPGLL